MSQDDGAQAPMMKDPQRPAEGGDFVYVHYRGMLEDDSVFDSSDGREPMGFELGAGKVIAGFDEGVTGMRVGETKKVIVPPEEGYGPWRPDLIARVERAMAGEHEVAPGTAVRVQTPEEEEEMDATIVELDDETITLDFNHPLAGKVLTFEITLVGIEPPDGA